MTMTEGKASPESVPANLAGDASIAGLYQMAEELKCILEDANSEHTDQALDQLNDLAVILAACPARTVGDVYLKTSVWRQSSSEEVFFENAAPPDQLLRSIVEDIARMAGRCD